MPTTPPIDAKRLISTCLPILFFLVLSFLFCFPLLKDLHISLRGDWDYFFTLYEIPSISLFEYHQFPLWNPYCGGGLPFIGNPQQGFPSPIFFVTSLFGAVAGLKLSVWLHTCLGLWGMWLLGGQIGIRGAARLAPPVIFMFSGPWAFHLTEGHIVWLPAAFLPLVMLAYLKGLENRRWLVAAAIFEALMIYEGGTYVFAFSMLFLAVFALCRSFEERRWKPILVFAGINILAAALAAPKLLPIFDLLGGHSRLMDAGQALSWADFIGIFIERDHKMGTVTMELGSYVGVLVVVLYFCGIATIRKQLSLVLASLLMLLLSVGNFAPFAPWTLLHNLPFFRNFQMPTRSMIIFCFSMALIVGLYLARWTKTGNRWAMLLVSVVVLYIGIDLFTFGNSIFPQAAIPVQPFVFRRNGPTRLDKPAELYHVTQASTTGVGRSIASVHQPFSQISIPDLERFRHGAWSDQYLPLLQNKGVVDAYETIPFKRHSLPVNDKGYKGEYYFLGGGNAELLNWSPNKLSIRVRLGREDRLVINQNYWPGWRSSRGVIVDHEGLLAVDLPAGEFEVAINYLPYSFLFGLGMLCATVPGIILFLRARGWTEPGFRSR